MSIIYYIKKILQDIYILCMIYFYNMTWLMAKTLSVSCCIKKHVFYTLIGLIYMKKRKCVHLSFIHNNNNNAFYITYVFGC